MLCILQKTFNFYSIANLSTPYPPQAFVPDFSTLLEQSQKHKRMT